MQRQSTWAEDIEALSGGEVGGAEAEGVRQFGVFVGHLDSWRTVHSYIPMELDDEMLSYFCQPLIPLWTRLSRLGLDSCCSGPDGGARLEEECEKQSFQG